MARSGLRVWVMWGLVGLGLSLLLGEAHRAAAQSLSDAFSEAEGLADNFHAVWNNRSEAEGTWYRRADQAVQRARAEAAREAARQAELQRERAAQAAEQAREQAIERKIRQENRANAWAGRGQADLEAGHYTLAIQEFHQAMRLWPDGPNSQFAAALQAALHDIVVVRQLHRLAGEAASDLRDVPSGASTLQLQGPGATASASSLQLSGPGISTEAEIHASLAAQAAGGLPRRPNFGNGPGARYENKGWDAIVLHDYAVAAAWYEVALQHDPGNMVIANMVDLLKDLERRDGDPYSYFSGAGVRLPPRVAGPSRAPPSTPTSQEARRLLAIFQHDNFADRQIEDALLHVGEHLARRNARRSGGAN